MREFVNVFAVLPVVLCVLFQAAFSQVPPNNFANFECSQTNPVRLSPDGTRLFAVNTPAASVSVFDVSHPSKPVLIAEIPVGIEPVSVNPRSNDEAWVVNQESDSVSIVSVAKGIVRDTIYAKDEPSDVVFAAGRAFVSESRNNRIGVFDATTHAPVADIPVFGGNPRALAVSPDGLHVYAAFALSGNHTTVIPYEIAPPPPAPANPALPPAPQQAIIVDARDPHWRQFIQFTMPDNDVVEIDAASLRVTRYFSGVGTINLGLTVNPANGDLYVANTDARNLVRFAPNLRGHFADNRITRISAATGTVSPFDLNPDIDYSVLPNPAALATALALPTAAVFDPGGRFLWVAAFGTDRIARVSPDGAVLQRIEIGPATGAQADSRHKRGPRGLALNAAAQTLYVLNRISNTLSVVHTSTGAVLREIPTGSFDPTPDAIRNGRGFLYDAKLSGNGTGACATCHVDGDMDHLAWDLGDPGGKMQTVVRKGMTFEFHPMKGPMTTQTLKGLRNREPYHWRGDQENFAAFSQVFDKVMGGAELSTADMTSFRNFVETLQFQPNPYQNLDRSLPDSLADADPKTGLKIFTTQPFLRNGKCRNCHTLPVGTSTLIVPAVLNQLPQAYVAPQLRNIYQKLLFDNTPGAASIDGFGLVNDGADAGLFKFLSNPVFGSFATDKQAQAHLAAYLQSFDTGVAPAVGYTRTVTAANVRDSAVIRDWALLESQAAPKRSWVYPLESLAPGKYRFPAQRQQGCDLIVRGTIDGRPHGLLYQPSADNYVTDQTGLGPFTHAQLVAFIEAGDILSPMGVPPGSGGWMGIGARVP
jgi:YVTN family beta-propeller protein